MLCQMTIASTKVEKRFMLGASEISVLTTKSVPPLQFLSYVLWIKYRLNYIYTRKVGLTEIYLAYLTYLKTEAGINVKIWVNGCIFEVCLHLFTSFRWQELSDMTGCINLHLTVIQQFKCLLPHHKHIHMSVALLQIYTEQSAISMLI